MIILQINASYGDGSTGIIVNDIQEYCHKNGFMCYVAYCDSSFDKDSIINGYKVGNFVSNKIHALLSRINGKQAYFSFYETSKFLRFLDDLKPDIINLHNLHNNYINLNMLLNYIAKHNIKTVVTLHDCWFFTGGCFHYTYVKCDKWKARCGDCPKKKLDTKAYFLDKSTDILLDRYKYFNQIRNLTVVGVSKWVTSECKKSVFKNNHCVTIYNGIDTEIFKPTQSCIREELGLDDKFIILGPASKWLDPINKKVLDVMASNLKDDEVLLLFGCSKPNMNLGKNIKTIGYVKSRHKLAELYSASDIFVNCSREDTLSTINLEAQACGTPIITFNNTGSTETVDGINSFCIETGDAHAFIKLINDIRMHKIAISKSELIYWIKRNFNKAINYKKYITLYKKLMIE